MRISLVVVSLFLLCKRIEAFTTREPFCAWFKSHLRLYAGSWDEAYTLARNLLANMTIDEKLGIVIGTGQVNPQRMQLNFHPQERLFANNIFPFRALRW